MSNCVLFLAQQREEQLENDANEIARLRNAVRDLEVSKARLEERINPLALKCIMCNDRAATKIWVACGHASSCSECLANYITDREVSSYSLRSDRCLCVVCYVSGKCIDII